MKTVGLGVIVAACAFGCISSISDPAAFYLAADAGDQGAVGGSNGGTGTGTGSSGTGGKDGGGTPNCDAPDQVFASSCYLCHAQPSPLGDLDLASPGVPSRLVGVQSSLCPGEILAIPSNPQGSYLIEKMVDASPPCGHQMPETGSVSAKEITCVIDWVANLSVDGGTQPTSGTGGSTATTGVNSSSSAGGATGTGTTTGTATGGTSTGGTTSTSKTTSSSGAATSSG